MEISKTMIELTLCKLGNLSAFWCLLVVFQNQVLSLNVVSVICFGVRVSVMFHFMFVHYTFSSVWVAEWPHFGK